MESQEEKAASLALSALQTIMASPIVFLVSGLSWAILKHFPVAVHKENKIFSSKKLLAYNIMCCNYNEFEPGQNLGPLVIPPAEEPAIKSNRESWITLVSQKPLKNQIAQLRTVKLSSRNQSKMWKVKI